ncbi:MAG TPA: class I SAM-dependent methyltransferase, partial [Myxococcota bacterium]|nr:class I SAM-dependent methyltransferase [Myxococcota bacterium]
MSRDPIETWYPESRFGGFTDYDGTLLFYSRIRSLLAADSVVLDAGCGRGVHGNDSVAYRRDLRNLRGVARRVIGIDVEPSGSENPFLDEFHEIAADGKFPVADGTCDLVYSDWVLEHVRNPELFFSECARVLKKDGVLALRTANALGYVALLARLIPRRFHVRILSRAQNVRSAQDMFPPVYACNSRRALRAALARAGFDGVVYTRDAEPRYFLFSRLLYAFAVFHQRFSPPMFRLSLVAFAR